MTLFKLLVSKNWNKPGRLKLLKSDWNSHLFTVESLRTLKHYNWHSPWPTYNDSTTVLQCINGIIVATKDTFWFVGLPPQIPDADSVIHGSWSNPIIPGIHAQNLRMVKLWLKCAYIGFVSLKWFQAFSCLQIPHFNCCTTWTRCDTVIKQYNRSR